MLNLIAAHCIKGKKDEYDFGINDFSVLLGVHNHSTPCETGRISAEVKSIHIHHHWSTDAQSYDGDIAVLELVTEVRFDNYIRPICLAHEYSKIINATHGTVVGFGRTDDGSYPAVAKKLDIPITKFNECIRESSDHETLASARMFCGGPADGRGVCDGDSGSGVYVLHNRRFYLRGLVSSSLLNDNFLCDTERKAAFTDVTHYYDWINRGGLGRN